MVIYEEITEEKLIIPKVSELYCLEPEGLGTVFIESLSSYISRLANTHCVKPGTLFSQVFSPYLNKKYTNQIVHRGGNGFYDSAHTINGVTETASEFTTMISDLTQMNRMSELTLLKFKGIFPNRGLLRKKKAWCPSCF